MDKKLVSVVMGSGSDWDCMRNSCDILRDLGIDYESRVVSAHRTPDLMYSFAGEASSRGVFAIIAGAGGAAHLPGMLAALTQVPVIAVPIKSQFMDGLDSLLSIVQMPAGVPVATMSVGTAGAKNAALLAAAFLAASDKNIAKALADFRKAQSDSAKSTKLD